MVTTEQSKPKAPEKKREEYRVTELKLRLPKGWDLSWERLFELGELNELCQFERTAKGELLVSAPPPPPESGYIETSLRRAIVAWDRDEVWYDFGSTFGYELSDGSLLISDASFVPAAELPPRGDPAWRTPFKVAPPVVVEVRSPGQTLASQQRKMEQYIANGVQLGWLFDPSSRQVHIYRPEQAPEVLDDPATLSGEEVMKGLSIDMSEMWP